MKENEARFEAAISADFGHRSAVETAVAETLMNCRDELRPLGGQAASCWNGCTPDRLLRTLQRRLKVWRGERAHTMIFGLASGPAERARAIGGNL